MKKSKIKIIALFGKSGSGKDTIQKWLVRNSDVHGIVSCTTRPARENEENGVAYHFLTEKDFTLKLLNGDLLEATQFRGWFYGTMIDALDPNKLNVGVFNIAGIQALLEDQRLEVYPVIVYAPDKIRLLRALMREENPDCAEICRRFDTDNKDFSKCDFQPFFVWENYDCDDFNDACMNNYTRLMEKIEHSQNDD